MVGLQTKLGREEGGGGGGGERRVGGRGRKGKGREKSEFMFVLQPTLQQYVIACHVVILEAETDGFQLDLCISTPNFLL